MLAVGSLLVGMATMLVPPRALPRWAGPLGAAVVAVLVAGGSIDSSLSVVGATLGALRDPLLFLLFAVPFAVQLDRRGFFAAAAARLDGGSGAGCVGATRRLWWLAAAVVVLFNLDAAVVLLTPLYVRVARRRGADPLLLGLQPALLACLASGVLPVSNLTNLLAANALHLHASAFVTHLGPPSVVAVTVGWCAYRRLAARHPTTPVPTGPLLPDDPPSTWSAAAGGAAAAAAGEAASGPAPRGGADRPAERAALRRGAPAVVLVLVGFTLGDRAGVPAWVVVALGMLALVPHTGQVPWRAIPHGAILLTAALGVLVAEAAPHLPLDALLGHGGLTGDLAAFGFGAFGSLAANNLPAAQVALGALHDPTQVWPLLVGLDMVPAVLLTASLSNLLWEGTARRLGVVTTGRRFSAVGLRVAVPAALSALLVLLALGRLR